MLRLRRSAGIRPETGPQPFAAGALLQQEFTFVVEDEQRKSPVQYTGTVVATGLVQMTDDVVLGIHQDQTFRIVGNNFCADVFQERLGCLLKSRL